MSKRKILVVSLIGLTYEGMTSVIYNYCSNMDRTDLDINYIAFDNMEEELKRKFNDIGRVLILPDRKKKFTRYAKQFLYVLKHGHYDVVHIHGNSGTMAVEVMISKICGIKKIITHCHNTTCNYEIVHRTLKTITNKKNVVHIACGRDAGEWMYGNKPFIILNNAIDVERFRPDIQKRLEIRKEFNINNEILIGHVGHFTEQKNQGYLVRVFYEFHKFNNNAKLLLVGMGESLHEIKELVKQYNLENTVIFAGNRSDIDSLYQGMDIFIMPSRWEGLPVVLLEAQAAGLPVIASDKITKEVQCSDNLYFMSFDDNPKKWAEKIQVVLNTNNQNRFNVKELPMKNSKFDIKKEAAVLREIYLK